MFPSVLNFTLMFPSGCKKSSYAVVAVILFACIIQMGTAKVLSKVS